MDVNIYAAVGLTLRVAGIVGLLVFVTPKQIRELRRPRNEYSGLRWVLFGMVSVYLFFTILVSLYTLTTLTDTDSSVARNAAIIISNLGSLLFSGTFILLYNYDAVVKKRIK